MFGNGLIADIESFQTTGRNGSAALSDGGFRESKLNDRCLAINRKMRRSTADP